MGIRDQFQSLGANIGRNYRGVKRSVVSGATALTSFSPYIPKHLAFALQDLHIGDAQIARDFYEGRYPLADKMVESEGKSPFLIHNAPDEWIRYLQSFAWLTHFSVGADAIAINHATALVSEWIEKNGGDNPEIAWDTEIVSKRLIAWLNHSITLLSASNYEFHKTFMRSLGAHVRFLKRNGGSGKNELCELYAHIALAYASICFSGQKSSLENALPKLAKELQTQVLADGSHIDRNPNTVLELLIYLLPLREGCAAAGKELPAELGNTIERLLLALRFLRMGDGFLARFNGSSGGQIELLSAMMRHMESHTDTALNGKIGGYERLQMGNTIAIMDVDAPPKGELSLNAHAGCLSFEFSSGRDCLIVNIGKPGIQDRKNPAFWRSTAAHSTAVFYETSSCKFENTSTSSNLLDGQVFGAQLKASSERNENAEAISVTASHLGYIREFGARHQRSLRLDENGNRLTGQDWFSGPDKEELYYTTKDAVAIHFHLHPTVKVSKGPAGNQILLETRSGETWQFSCNEVAPQIGESIFLGNHIGAQKTKQIALHFNACKTAQINWFFEKQ